MRVPPSKGYTISSLYRFWKVKPFTLAHTLTSHPDSNPNPNLGCRVVGCTTNKAASDRDILSKWGADVLIVEEAGEVLEYHVLAALPEAAQHLIMIGDHMQLRPKIENYDLDVENKSRKAELNVSLFERLVCKSALGHGQLLTQHRMHPEIGILRPYVSPQTYS